MKKKNILKNCIKIDKLHKCHNIYRSLIPLISNKSELLFRQKVNFIVQANFRMKNCPVFAILSTAAANQQRDAATPGKCKEQRFSTARRQPWKRFPSVLEVMGEDKEENRVRNRDIHERRVSGSFMETNDPTNENR